MGRLAAKFSKCSYLCAVIPESAQRMSGMTDAKETELKPRWGLKL